MDAAPLDYITAHEIINKFFKLIILWHGSPVKVFTDKGTQFCSELFNEQCDQFNIEHLTSFAYHPHIIIKQMDKLRDLIG